MVELGVSWLATCCWPCRDLPLGTEDNCVQRMSSSACARFWRRLKSCAGANASASSINYITSVTHDPLTPLPFLDLTLPCSSRHLRFCILTCLALACPYAGVLDTVPESSTYISHSTDDRPHPVPFISAAKKHRRFCETITASSTHHIPAAQVAFGGRVPTPIRLPTSALYPSGVALSPDPSGPRSSTASRIIEAPSARR